MRTLRTHSTRIRTNEHTIVTFPNGDFSSRQIDNHTLRCGFLFDPAIGLIDDRAMVRFASFGNSSLDNEIFAHIRADDYPYALGIQERFMLSIMEVVTSNGADFAFPTRTVHIARMTRKKQLKRP